VLAQISPWLCLLCLVFHPLVVDAQVNHPRIADQYRIAWWTSENGLPQNTVYSLLQTHEGYLWIGTKYGLARYDGLRMVDHTGFLENNEGDFTVVDMAEDTDGQLWILTGQRLLRSLRGKCEKSRLGRLLLGECLRRFIGPNEGECGSLGQTACSG
jgi:ligand-binding sensor domain-containing protein